MTWSTRELWSSFGSHRLLTVVKVLYSQCEIAFIAFALLVVAGCGDGRPQRVPVSGRVLIDGQPLKFGYVRFIPRGARASGGTLDESGRFVLGCFEVEDGAVLGEHQVEVMAQNPLSETEIRWLAPKKYATYNTSGLTYNVTGPTDSATLELTWKGGKPFVETIVGSAQEGDNPY